MSCVPHLHYMFPQFFAIARNSSAVSPNVLNCRSLMATPPPPLHRGCGEQLWWGAVMVSWCHMLGPAPPGAVACGPGQAKAAQYRSKCNALSRGAHTPSPPCSLFVQGHTARAVPHGPHGYNDAAVLVLCSGTHPMPSVLPKEIHFPWAHTHARSSFAWAHAQCLQLCQK